MGEYVTGKCLYDLMENPAAVVALVEKKATGPFDTELGIVICGVCGANPRRMSGEYDKNEKIRLTDNGVQCPRQS